MFEKTNPVKYKTTNKYMNGIISKPTGRESGEVKVNASKPAIYKTPKPIS